MLLVEVSKFALLVVIIIPLILVLCIYNVMRALFSFMKDAPLS